MDYSKFLWLYIKKNPFRQYLLKVERLPKFRSDLEADWLIILDEPQEKLSG